MAEAAETVVVEEAERMTMAVEAEAEIIAVAVAVGLETLPLLDLCLVALSVAWMLGVAGSRLMLQSTAAACAVATIAVVVAVVPPGRYGQLRSDMLSAPFAALLFGFGVIGVGLTAVFRRDGFAPAKAALLAIVGLSLLLAILWCFPALRDGPFPMIDARVHALWFDRIDQEMSALAFFRLGDFRAVLFLVAMGAILLLSAPTVWADGRSGRAVLPVLFAIACGAVLMVLATNRFLRLAVAIVPFLLPAALQAVRRAGCLFRQAPAGLAWPVGAMACLALALVVAVRLVPQQRPGYDAFDHLLSNGCEAADFSPLAALAPARIMTPPGLGLQILSRRYPGIAVSTIPFHRSSPAISRLLATFMTTSPAERQAHLQAYDYVAFCRAPRDVPGLARLPLFEALLNDRPVAGLHAVLPPSAEGLAIYRIDPAALE